MKLTQLDASFRKLSLGPPEDNWPNGRPSHGEVATLAEADGVEFLCPKCFAANNGPVGTHVVICWFVGKVPDWLDPKPGRWNPRGDNLANLTFVPPGNTSVQLIGGCGWHGFVSNGDAA